MADPIEACSSNAGQVPPRGRRLERPIPVGRTLPGTHQRAAAWEAGPRELYTFDAEHADPVVAFRRHLRFGRELAVRQGSTRFVLNGVTERVLPHGTSSEPELLDLLGDVVRRAETPRPGLRQRQQQLQQGEEEEEEAAADSNDESGSDSDSGGNYHPSTQHSLRPTTETFPAQGTVPTTQATSSDLTPFPELEAAPAQALARPRIGSSVTETAAGSSIPNTATAVPSSPQTETGPRPRTRARSGAVSLPRPLDDF